MVWKKNFVSVILWVVYFLSISAALMYYVYDAVSGYDLPGMYTAPLLTMGLWGGIILLFIACRLLAKRLPHVFLCGNSEKAEMLEGILFIAFITAGLILRIVNLNYAGESAAYYDVAKVTEGGDILEVTHGATFFYVILMRILLFIVGNKWIAGIWLQLVLQFVTSLLLYEAVRKLAGTVAGLVFLGTMMILSTEVMRGITYSPQMFYLFVYAVAFLCAAVLLDRQVRGCRKRKSSLILLLFTGAFIGFACYLDVAGLTLLIPVLFALHMKTEVDNRREVVWSILVTILLAVLFFLGYIWLDAFVCDKNLLDILSAWVEIFRVKARDIWFWHGEDAGIGIMVLGFMVFGAPGFWVSGKYHRFSLWITMLLVFCVMGYFHIPVENMGIGIFLLTVGSILAGIGIRECLYGGKATVAKDADSEFGTVEKFGTVGMFDDGEEDVMETSGIIEESKAEETVKPVNYIDNPLPLPKKHLKRVLDYSLEPQEEFMYYDFEVAEEDDFDL